MTDPVTYRWDRNRGFSRMNLYPLSGTVTSTSVYTGRTRFGITANTPWVADCQLPTLADEDDWRSVRSLLLKLHGGRAQVRLFNPSGILPRGAAAGISRDFPNGRSTTEFSDSTEFSDGTQFADGSSTARLARDHLRGEANVLLKGLLPNQDVALDADDHMEIGGFLYVCVDSVRSDSSGQSLVPIIPPLRQDALAVGPSSVVNFKYPTSPFVLSDPSYSGFDVTPPLVADIGLKFIEVLP